MGSWSAGERASDRHRPPWGGSSNKRFPHFSPYDRSFCIAQRGKRTVESPIALSMPSRPSRDWRSATLKTIAHHVQSVSWRPSTASVTMSPQGGRWRSEKRSPALQEPIFGVFGAPNFTNTQKSIKMAGYIFFSGLLTMLRRQVYAFDHRRCPKSGYINCWFLPLYVIMMVE